MNHTTPDRPEHELPRRFQTFTAGGRRYRRIDLAAAERAGFGEVSALPFSLRVVLENLLRNAPETGVDADTLRALFDRRGAVAPLTVSRIVLPDSSGLPALMDMAALRQALARRRVDPTRVQPRIPVDLVVDHSLTVDAAGSAAAQDINIVREYERNAERYAFFKWAQQAFDGLRVVPPGMGIIHQVHIEQLARVVGVDGEDVAEPGDEPPIAFPEFVIGGDSHTPMVNALGVLGWGVGGVEAEAAMLGQPYVVKIPRVVGVRLAGALSEGATTTDLVLTVTQRLRQLGVVGDYVEFFGPGVGALSVPERATLANMAPEYGAGTGFFPIDSVMLDYLRQTGRDEAHVDLVETYAREAGLFRDDGSAEPRYDAVTEIDLAEIEPSLAGPRRPQDRLALSAVKDSFLDQLGRPLEEDGFAVPDAERDREVSISLEGQAAMLRHGSIVIAAITSCTNTSNPSVMLGAGLLARNAVAAGLSTAPWIKTSLAPGSRVVTRYLEKAGLMEPLEQLGFHVVGYGCTTCSGKSGPLAPPVAEAIEENGLVAAAVLSGNRNFEGRIHRQVRANYIASPMLVVAYALAGRIDIDLSREPLGYGGDGQPVHLRDIWPGGEAIAVEVRRALDPAMFRENYAHVYDGTTQWHELKAPAGPLFPWPADSTYLLEPPFFASDRLEEGAEMPDALDGARVLCLFGDSLTTDHITPSGEIPVDSPAGRYLSDHGVAPRDFNAFTQRRGNHHVMMRGTFANPRLKNRLVPDAEGGVTRLFPENERLPIFEAAAAYRARGTPQIVLAGRDYGMGSSRDWAAKGPALLGVKAVIAKSLERIHRSNLIAMGIVPLAFADGEGWKEMGLDGSERYRIIGLVEAVANGSPVRVQALHPSGREVVFCATAVINSVVERSYLRRGGVFPAVYRRLLGELSGQWPAAAQAGAVMNGDRPWPTR